MYIKMRSVYTKLCRARDVAAYNSAYDSVTLTPGTLAAERVTLETN